METNDNPMGYFARVIRNDSLKKGVAAALAGALIAAAQEAIWPSKS